MVGPCKAGVFKHVGRYELQRNPDQASNDQHVVEMPDPWQKVGNEVERECQVSEGCAQTESGNSRGARVSENNAIKPQFARHRQCNILESLEHDGVSFGLNLLKRPGTKQSACCDVDHS